MREHTCLEHGLGIGRPEHVHESHRLVPLGNEPEQTNRFFGLVRVVFPDEADPASADATLRIDGIEIGLGADVVGLAVHSQRAAERPDLRHRDVTGAGGRGMSRGCRRQHKCRDESHQPAPRSMVSPQANRVIEGHAAQLHV